MSDFQILSVDPWLKAVTEPISIPADSTFLCAYGVHVGIDSIHEAAFLRRTTDRDELWLAMEPDPEILDLLRDGRSAIDINNAHAMQLGCAVVARRVADQPAASRALLDVLFRARVGHSWPTDLVLEGAIDGAAFRKLIQSIEAELEDVAQRARRNESEIVEAARALKLNPEATGTEPQRWRANCPGTNHGLSIQAATNEFFCGYCRKKGGPEDLRAFVKARRG